MSLPRKGNKRSQSLAFLYAFLSFQSLKALVGRLQGRSVLAQASINC
jgi:hypothetical protein